jgi:hypothetical protein
MQAGSIPEVASKLSLLSNRREALLVVSLFFPLKLNLHTAGGNGIHSLTLTFAAKGAPYTALIRPAVRATLMSCILIGCAIAKKNNNYRSTELVNKPYLQFGRRV